MEDIKRTILSHDPYSGHTFRSILLVLFEDPVFRTGNEDWDTYLTIALYFSLLLSAGIVVRAFIVAKRQRQKREDHEESARKKELLRYLLAYALIALTLTSVLRYQHRRIKLSSLAVIQRSQRLANIWSDDSLQDHLTSDAAKWKFRAYKYAYTKLPDTLVKAVPWLPVDWSRNASVWDYFKLLVDEPRRSWWTRQWVMGYLGWAVFVGYECGARGFGTVTALSFILLGHCTSLAAMQSLFHALTLLSSKRDASEWQTYAPKPLAVLPLIQALVLEGLPYALDKMSSGRVGLVEPESGWRTIFAILQSTTFLLPLLAPAIRYALIAAQGKGWIGESVGNMRWSRNFQRRSAAYVWSAYSLFSILLHWHSLYQVFVEANAGRSWPALGLLLPWKSEQERPLRHSAAHFLGALGDHPWINALAWDVLFSAGSLCFFSCACGLHAEKMLQFSMAPWMKDAIELAEDIAQETQRRTQDVKDAAAAAFEAADPLNWIRTPEQKARRRKERESLEQQIADEAENADKPIATGTPRVKERIPRNARPRKRVQQKPEVATRPSRRSNRLLTRNKAREDHEVKSDVSPARNATTASLGTRAPRSVHARPESGMTAAEDQEQDDLVGETPDEELVVKHEQAAIVLALFFLGGLGAASAAAFGAGVY